MNLYSGIAASSSYAIGKIFILANTKLVIPCRKIPSSKKTSDWNRFQTALGEAVASISESISTAKEENKEIFQTHLLMLSDYDFISQVKQSYDENSYNIEYILNNKVLEFADKLKNSGNTFFQDRSNDIVDAYNHVLCNLLQIEPFSTDKIPENAIIAAESISPSQALTLSELKISGFITKEGGADCHLAILARSYGIPFVSGIKDVTTLLKNDETVILDGTNGLVISEPDEETLDKYRKLQAADIEYQAFLEKYADKPAKTKDGTAFTLLANITSVEETKKALKNGADGVGLFRTEFLFMNHDSITEDFQYETYKSVLSAMQGKPVTIRTLDAGGDKIIDTQDFIELDAETSQEKNPLLGCRAIRFCSRHPDIFKTQLRALLRASAGFDSLKIMIPLICSVSEVTQTLKLIEEIKSELASANIDFCKTVPVGIMVETPAASILADRLAKVSDFFSIGTNDLTQYTLCVDRENTLVADLFSEFNPAVLLSIKNIVEAAHSNDIHVSVCGELASKPEGVFILAGLGVHTLSTSPSFICRIKHLLSLFDMKEITEITSKALELEDASKTIEYINKFITERMKNETK